MEPSSDELQMDDRQVLDMISPVLGDQTAVTVIGRRL